MRRANLDFPWRKVGFGTNYRKINDLVLTVDQEVGGSNPLSCTGYLQPSCAKPVGWRLLSVRDTLLGDAMGNRCRRDNAVLACRVDVGVLRVVRNVLQAQARFCASLRRTKL